MKSTEKVRSPSEIGTTNLWNRKQSNTATRSHSYTPGLTEAEATRSVLQGSSEVLVVGSRIETHRRTVCHLPWWSTRYSMLRLRSERALSWAKRSLGPTPPVSTPSYNYNLRQLWLPSTIVWRQRNSSNVAFVRSCEEHRTFWDVDPPKPNNDCR